jgi:hypothetical protein
VNKKVVAIFFIATVLAVLPGLIPPYEVACAQEPESECWAVMVGVADYEWLEDLPYCDDDARELSQLLSPVWGEDHIKLLLDSQATRANILGALDWLAEKEDADDTVLFYFSGYGGRGILCPYDTAATYTPATLLSEGELNDELNRLDSKKMTIILDTGNAGEFQLVLSASGRVILMGCSSNEPGYYSSIFRHGVFTYYILQALRSFYEADANHDYELSAEEVFQYAEPKIVSLAQTMHLEQHPVLSDRYSGDLALLVEFVFKTKPSLPFGTEVMVLDDKPYTSIPSTGIVLTWAPGSAHSLNVQSVVEQGTSTRYVFTSWDDGDTSVSRTVSGGVYTANYDKEHLLTINSAYDEPEGGGWYKEGGTANISVAALIEEPATKHIFTGWSGDLSGATANATLTMSSPKVVTVNWRNEYLLTITSPYGEPKGVGWYKEGETANISVATVEGVIIRQIFTGWSGDFTGTTASATLIMNSPTAVTANWRNDYIQLYILIGGVVVLGAAIVAIIVVLRKRRKKEIIPGKESIPGA